MTEHSNLNLPAISLFQYLLIFLPVQFKSNTIIRISHENVNALNKNTNLEKTSTYCASE